MFLWKCQTFTINKKCYCVLRKNCKTKFEEISKILLTILKFLKKNLKVLKIFLKINKN